MEPSRSDKVCCICKKTDDDKYAYGEWQMVKGYAAHQFCLLFLTKTDNTVWNANIIDNVDDFETSICYKCGDKYATVTCARSDCHRAFHVVCGDKNHCLLEYVEPYNAYCHEHHTITDTIPDSWHCQTCLDDYKDHDPIEYIPSCCDQSWYHRVCIRTQAYFTGDNMKCPSCGEFGEERKAFQRFVRTRGVYIPARSALYPLNLAKKKALAKTQSN